MSARRAVPPSAAAVSDGDGCLSGYLIPPLAVLVVSLLMFCLLGSSGALVATSVTEVPQGEEAQFFESASAAGEQSGSLTAIFTPEVQYWANDILRWAAGAGLDPNLVATVMQIESCGNPRARSRAGAMGLFQVMPYHFAAGENPYDPDTNARRGLDYLRRSQAKAGASIRLTFAGYNGGLGVIGRPESTWAGETIRYAYWGSGIYESAVRGETSSIRLQEWLLAGGTSLCQQAAEQLGLGR